MIIAPVVDSPRLRCAGRPSLLRKEGWKTSLASLLRVVEGISDLSDAGGESNEAILSPMPRRTQLSVYRTSGLSDFPDFFPNFRATKNNHETQRQNCPYNRWR